MENKFIPFYENFRLDMNYDSNVEDCDGGSLFDKHNYSWATGKGLHAPRPYALDVEPKETSVSIKT